MAGYVYGAQAVALSGSLTRPLVHDVGEIAKSEIAGETGGYISSRMENHRYHEIFSFRAAYTQVTASEGPDGHFNTLAIATIEDLNVLDILKVERIVARLVSLHCADDFAQCPHPWVLPLGSEIVNLRIAGRPYAFNHPPGFHLDMANAPAYDEWKKKPHTYATEGETFHVPRFGTVTLCQLRVENKANPKRPEHGDQWHHLSMLKIALSSPVGGTLEGGDTGSNGSPPTG